MADQCFSAGGGGGDSFGQSGQSEQPEQPRPAPLRPASRRELRRASISLGEPRGAPTSPEEPRGAPTSPSPRAPRRPSFASPEEPG